MSGKQQTKETFRSTNRLRWLVTTFSMCDGPGTDIKSRRLQQAWQDDRGNVWWRDIEEVDVEETDEEDWPVVGVVADSPQENPEAGRQQSEPLEGRVSNEVFRQNIQHLMG